MAEAVRLKVDVNVFQETLTKLGNVLEELENKKGQMEKMVSHMGTEEFEGSDLDSTIALANKELEQVKNAINKVRAQKDMIEKSLQTRETSASTLQSDVSSIDEALPDIFANS